jgi:hypothetical protein
MLWSCTLINRLSLAASRTSEMVRENRHVFLRHVLAEWIPGQRVSVGAQQLGAGQVDFLDVTILVQGDVAQRGEIVEIDVAIAVGFQTSLGLLQFLVLRLQFPLLGAKCLLHLLAIDGVMDGPSDGRGVGLAFDQIILRTAAHCLPCYGLVGHAGEYDDRQVRGSGRKLADGLQAVRVGQRQVEQDRVKSLLPDGCLGLFEGRRSDCRILPRMKALQHALQQ